ncbi:phage tail sheath family protein [Pseudokordiimonas caeni]|uniref:phage tail sheath family protein n=1 Tax=Pseudokordiimonas caeni TaxID=2997908 RepID=UPI0028115FA8|nr:phage tail sheath C-terminal domain-containing protein [Pseudokordiimonas caeni]
MPAYRTPDIYIEEIPLFPPSIAEVETAIPIFIGHTRFAEYQGASLLKKPIKIRSLMEYHERFGRQPPACIGDIAINAQNKLESVRQVVSYNLYDSVSMFFMNGGGACYILSIGDFSLPSINASGAITKDKYIEGLQLAAKVDEVTLILMPDAVNLPDQSLYTVQQQALVQCNTLMDRFAIFDLYEYEDAGGTSGWEKGVQEFRDKVGINYLKYGAAYTPYLVADMDRPLGFAHFQSRITKNKVPVQLEDLTDDASIVDLIRDTSEANDTATRMSTVTYGNLAPTSPLVNVMPNLVNSQQTSDLEAFVAGYKIPNPPAGVTPDPSAPKPAKPKTLQELYNQISAALRSAKQAADQKTILGTLQDLTFKVLTDVVMAKWLMSDANADAVRQHVNDHLASFIEDLVASGSSDYPQIFADILGRIDALYKAAGLTKPATDDDAAKLGNLGRAIYALSKTSKPANVTVSTPDQKAQTDTLFRATLRLISGVQTGAYRHLNNLEQSLRKLFPLYNNIVERAERVVRTMPPSGAIAGLYAAVDRDRGVWKAPANVSLASVSALTHQIDSFGQESLNIDVTGGKSVNAIRPFVGKGFLVWGARTLMGNDNEWRYISVRRFFNMVEESVKKSTYWAVFEPNDSNLWMKVKSSIEAYLHEKRMQGALAGVTDKDAFVVNVGLNSTMTAQDILEGRLIIEIKMAVVRPAEFIIMRFMHKMQES